MTRRVVLGVAALGFLAPSAGWAQGVLSVEIVNGYNLVVDSNVTAPSTYAPRSAYIGATVCNTGNAALDNVVANVGDDNGGVGDTPGVFPVWSSAGDPRPFIADTGDYSLTLEAGETGIADGARYIGTLDPGECKIQYWLFSYPQCVNVGGQPQLPPCDVSITGGIKPDDDVVLDYDVWATTTTAGVATASETRSFTLRNEISAAANKIWPNTASKVPDEYLEAIESVIGWGTLGPDGQPISPSSPLYPGERVITTQGIWYDLGTVVHGFDNDGDLVPDYNAWLQPVGDPASFDADCFRMLNVYGVVIVKLKTGGELLIPFRNQLYFENLPENTGVVGLVYYQYMATDEGCSASLTPYQEAASGFDNEKFSADYGLSLALESGSYGTDLTFTKTDGVSSTSPGSTLTYTLEAPNGTSANLGAPELGTPLVFRETIPAGTTFVAGSADDSPATNLDEPAGVGSYQLGFTDRDDNLDTCTLNYTVTASSFVVRYSADGGATWSVTEPAGVTDIEWRLSTTLALDGGHDRQDCVAPDGAYDDGTAETSLPAGKTTRVRFQVTVDTAGGPVICNTGTLAYGSATTGTDAQDCTLVSGNNSLSGTVFEDDGGTGGIYGNGAIDNATEVGIGAGLEVTLYYDLNGDGQADAGDISYASTTTAANGTYSFTGLADGPYVVVVKKYDGATSDGLTNAMNDFLASRCSPVGTCSDTGGWGNTTLDPNLPLTNDQGILKLNEDLTTASLAVNIDLDSSDATSQAITGVNFGFAPPFRLTKSVAGNPDVDANGVADIPVDDGDIFSYSILLENLLPSVGRQGPTGCEYTAWAPTGVNGTPANKAFTDPGNAWDASSPNRTYASAEVTGGGLRFIYGTGFSRPVQPGTITKVEALFFGFFGTALNDDFLNVTARLGAGTSTATIDTARIDSYVGEPADLDPSSAIAWNITSLRPGGGAWSWSDAFSTVQLEINPSKASSADQRTFYLDAIGLRITTDQACQANSSTTLSPVPLQDTYDTGTVAFVSADPPPTSVNTGTGVIQWTDVGPILPGSSKTVTVTVQALDITGSVSGGCGASPPPTAGSACNWAQTAHAGLNVKYADGRPANDDEDSIAVNLQGKAEIRGRVWNDTNNDGWPDNDAEAGLGGVTVTLFACVKSDGTLETGTSNTKDCATLTGGNSWQVVGSAVTSASGSYEFLGLDTGYYIVEVGDTDGAPATGSTSPYGLTQTAEPNDTQAASGGNAVGTAGICAGAGGCNNTWGNPAANLRADQTTINLLDAATEETVNGVNFGYYAASATLYGNVWHDIDGDASREPGEDGLPSFTVGLYSDPNGDGDLSDGTLLTTTTTDANGNYIFSGLSAASYVVAVTPPTLPNQEWVETVETTGGTSSLNNQIPVTIGVGQALSGSHDFGYTLADTSSIGDTVYLDFDGDGSQDPAEAGIPNITVRLYEDVDRDGTVDAGVDDLLATDVTDSAGNYLFENLAAGSYVVEVDTSDPDFPDQTTATGDPDVATGRIGDLVYLDADGDGVFDAGENGISGVVVLLYENPDKDGVVDPGEPQVAAVRADASGAYLFTGLAAGDYLVQIDPATLPAGLSLTSAVFANVTLATNASVDLNQDAGYSPATDYALGNRVWHDVDGDNVQDAGEVGIGGATVTVTRTTAGPCDTGCAATTDAAGFWYVTGLTNGSYTVAVSDLPRDFVATAAIPTQTIASADNMGADGGFRYTTPASTPTGTISGRVFQDADGDRVWDAGEEVGGATVNLLDDQGRVVGTTTSAADGTYSLTGVFIGEYAVQGISSLGTRYSVLFVSAGDSFPNLNVIYSRPVETVADGWSAVSVDGVNDDLTQDFGYRRFLGSIGDTVYLDANRNGTQDLGEPGIEGVSVNLLVCSWNDANADGIFESTERTACSTTATTTTAADDPATTADEGGKYLFANLPVLSAGSYYVVEVNETTLPGTAQELTADPETDGVPCWQLPSPDVSGDEFPPPGVCDGEHLLRTFVAGMNYLGADFGYVITGSGYGLFGDQLWIDANGDGQLNGGEAGLPWVTVWIDTDGDGVVDAGEPTTETNSDGYYLFARVADGTYTVRVLTSDPDWPAGLATTPTYEVRPGNTASLDNLAQVVVSGGVVTSIVDGDPGTGDPCTSCDLNVDFGYRYAGGLNSLSGTVCLDDNTLNGYCAGPTTYTGVGAGESPLDGIVVSLYQWTDTDADSTAWNASTGALDAGDTFTFLGSTTTDSNGDYAFTGVPGNVVVVLSVPAARNLDLTTTNANTGVEDAAVVSYQLYESTTAYEGNTVTVWARQALNLTGDADNSVVDLDFAFDPTLGGLITTDYGDLPESGSPDYNATYLASGGASHRIGALFLGASVTNETDGQPTSDASGDAGDDGVSLVGNQLTAGPSGGSVDVTATAAGWVAGWIDFDGDGTFNGAGEHVVSAAVVGGTTTFTFDVPYEINGGVSGTGVPFFARFRIYPEEPTFESPSGQALTSSFEAATGEVEDYAWSVDVTQAIVSSFVAREKGGGVTLEWTTSAETGTIGWYLSRWSSETGEFLPVNGELLPAVLRPQGGRYAFVDEAAWPGETHAYQLVEVEVSGRRNTYGPFVVNTAQAPEELETAADVDLDLDPGAEGYARVARQRPSRVDSPGAATATATPTVGPRRRTSPRASRVKLGVGESGIHAIPFADLAREGLTVDGALAGATLSNRGQRVAFAVSAPLQAVFFYGQALDSVFTRDNVYRFGHAAGSSPPIRSRQETVAFPPTGYETFLRTVHVEEDHVPATAIFRDPEGDWWLWDYVFAGWGPRTFPFRADGAVSGVEEATIRIRLKGSSDTPANPDHRAVFRLNGTSIGEVSWNGLGEVEPTLTFSSSLLVDGENVLEIEGFAGDGAPYSLFYLDAFDVRYPSVYRAHGDRITAPAAGHESLLVSGFTRGDGTVFDVTDPLRPVYVQAPVLPLAGGGFAVTLAPTTPDTVYQVLTPDAALRPTWVRGDEPSSLRRRSHQGEYLIVTTAGLKDVATRLAEHRGELLSLVVDIEDVYDEFNYAVPSPHALRRFLDYARRHWQGPPRYVVLAGDGSYDYRDALGEGDNLIPPMMVETPFGLFPSDVWFVEDETGGDMGMAIGRLPARSPEELERMIEKIQLRDAVAGAPWLRRRLYVSDNADKAGDFPFDSAQLAAMAPPGSLVQRIDITLQGGAGARTSLLAALGEGAGSVSYVGHGGYDVLADEGLLKNSDVAALGNGDRPTVLTALTCLANHFALPGYPGLGELLVRHEAGGAAAVWGPTGLSQNELAVGLAGGVSRATLAGDGVRLGDAIAAARREYRQAGWPRYLPLIYVLLGDPAMELYW